MKKRLLTQEWVNWLYVMSEKTVASIEIDNFWSKYSAVGTEYGEKSSTVLQHDII